MGTFKVLKGFLRPKSRVSSSQATADGRPSHSGNSRQEQSVDIPSATDLVQETPSNVLESHPKEVQNERELFIGSEERYAPTRERGQHNPDVDSLANVKAPEGHTSLSNSKPPELAAPRSNDELQMPASAAPIGEKAMEPPVLPSLRSKASTNSPTASRELSPSSKPSWSPERYSQQLWNLAYDSFKEENAEIMEQYETAIFAYIRAAEEKDQGSAHISLYDIMRSDKSEVSTADSGQTPRPLLMNSFLHFFLKRPAATERIDNIMADDANASSDEPESDDARSPDLEVEDAFQRRSYAYVPWVASCIALEWASQAAYSGHSDSRSSIISVVCSMDYYIDLSNLFFHPEEHSSSMPDKDSREWSLVILYKSILSLLIHTGLSELGRGLTQFVAPDSVYHSPLKKCDQEVKDKQRDFMHFNMKELEGKLTSWLDKATKESVEAPDVDGSSQHSSQQSDVASDDDESSEKESEHIDVWRTWNVAEQPSLDLDDSAIQLFDELYGWLQDTDEFGAFISWSDKPCDRVLLLDIDLGTGKTDLLRMVSSRLSRPLNDGVASLRNVVLFIPDSSSPNRNDPAFLLRTLISRLLEQQPSLNLPDTEKRYFDGTADFYALEMIFYSLLRSETLQPTYFVICDGTEASAVGSINQSTIQQHKTTKQSAYDWGLSDLLDMIATTVADCKNICWLVSLSICEEAVTSSSLEGCYRRVSITTNENRVREILAKHSASRVSEMAMRDSQKTTIDTTDICHRIQQSPHFSLLWINTALNMARRDPAYWNSPTIFSELMKDAPSMNSLYEMARQDIYKLREKDTECCVRILSTLTFAYRPLSSSELRDLVDLPETMSTTVLIKEFLPLFLKISNHEIPSEQIIDFVHPSAKDFYHHILSPPDLTSVRNHFSSYHRALASRCLQKLVTELSRDDNGVSSQDSFEVNRYAMIFWIRHILQMEEDVGRPDDLISRLVTRLRTKWLKAIDLWGLLQEALVLISDAEDAMLAANKSDIERPYDMRRIVREIGEFVKIHLKWTTVLRDSSSDDSYSEASVSNSFVFWPMLRPDWLAQAPTWDTRDYLPESCLQIMEHPDWVRSCAFSPCGRLVATGADDHSIRLWDTASGTLQHVLGDVGGFAYSVSISRSGPKGQPLLAACGSSTIKIWNLSTGLMIQELNGINDVVGIKTEEKTGKTVTFKHPVDATSASGDESDKADDDAETSGSSSTQADSSFLVEKIDISPGGNYLVALVNHCLVLWKTSNFECTILHELDEDKYLNIVRFSHDGQQLAVGIGSQIITYDVPTEAWESRGPTTYHQLPESPEEMGREAEVDAEQDDSESERSETSSTRYKSAEDYSGHSDAVFGLCYSPGQEKGNYLASGSDDRTARIWSLETRKTVVVLKHHEGDVNSVSFSADGRFLATASSDNTIAIWNQESPGNWGSRSRSLPVQILSGHSSMIWSVNFAPYGHRLVSSANDSQARVWEIDADSLKPRDLEQKGELEQGILRSNNESRAGHLQAVICVSVSPDGKILASGCQGGKIGLWDATTGAHLRMMKDAHSRHVASLVFSEDAKILVSTSWDGSAFVWNVDGTSTEAAHHLTGHYDWVRGAAISLKKPMVATACDDRAVRVWDISASPEPTSDIGGSESSSIKPRVFQGHGDYVFGAAFSRDGQYLASGGDDGIVMFWDLSDTGDKEKPDKEVDDRKNHRWGEIVFTHNDNTVFTVSERGVVALWKPNLGSAEECQCLAVCDNAETFSSVSSLRINPDQPDVFITNTGAWEFKIGGAETEQSDNKEPSLQLRRHEESLGISKDGRWITWDANNLILLPLKFRPTDQEPSHWVQSRYVVIGCESGQVLLFRLADGATPTLPRASQLKV